MVQFKDVIIIVFRNTQTHMEEKENLKEEASMEARNLKEKKRIKRKKLSVKEPLSDP